MTYFTLRAERAGDMVLVTWRDGQLAGDRAWIALTRDLALALEGERISPLGFPGGPTTTTRHLDSAHSAYTLLHMAMPSRATLVAGALPPLPTPPHGAMA